MSAKVLRLAVPAVAVVLAGAAYVVSGVIDAALVPDIRAALNGLYFWYAFM